MAATKLYDTDPPDLSALLDAERQVLNARLNAARAALSSHHGELGASLEHEATSFLRSFLPREYGLGRGFVVWRERCAPDHPQVSLRIGALDAQNQPVVACFKPAISSQLDVIVYDAIRSGPIADLGASQLYPIEHVYGYVEVKTVFVENLEEILKVSARLRTPEVGYYQGRPQSWRPLVNDEQYKAIVQSVENGPIDQANAVTSGSGGLLARLSVWVFAFEYDRHGSKTHSADSIRAHVERVWRGVNHPAHLSGVLLVRLGPDSPTGAYLRSIPDTTRRREFEAEVFTSDPLGHFKRRMMTELATYPRLPEGLVANYDGYWGVPPGQEP